MGQMFFGLVLLAVAFFLRLGASAVRAEGARPVGGALRLASLAALVIGVLLIIGSTAVVINAGEVGVQHAFGSVNPSPLLPGIRMVPPWSSSEQMGMTVDVGLRWQIDPQQAARIYTEIGNEDQIHSAVRNALRKGVRDGMVQYSINDISKRTQIATTMEALVDSALVTTPRAGGGKFRIATVTAFF